VAIIIIIPLDSKLLLRVKESETGACGLQWLCRYAAKREREKEKL
jgi:hypothetical protein